jgi:hypothetical protein
MEVKDFVAKASVAWSGLVHIEKRRGLIGPLGESLGNPQNLSSTRSAVRDAGRG